MTTYDRAVFWRAIRPMFGTVAQGQVEGTERILAGYEAKLSADSRWVAYALATAFHETAATMQPIEEYGRGVGRAYHAGGFWGRGLVQLTWQFNYADWSKRLGLDLINHPELALTWGAALPILMDGMALGTFTGASLGAYFTAKGSDPVNARRIINGLDRAVMVAGYYAAFLAALKTSQRSVTV